MPASSPVIKTPGRFTGMALPLATEGRSETPTERQLGNPCLARGPCSAEILRYSLGFYLLAPRSLRLAEYSLAASSYPIWKWGSEALATAVCTAAKTRARIAMGHVCGMQSVGLSRGQGSRWGIPGLPFTRRRKEYVHYSRGSEFLSKGNHDPELVGRDSLSQPLQCGRTDTRDVHDLLDGRKGAVLLAIVDDLLSAGRTDAG